MTVIIVFLMIGKYLNYFMMSFPVFALMSTLLVAEISDFHHRVSCHRGEDVQSRIALLILFWSVLVF